MKEIKLSPKGSAFIDNKDFKLISKYKWRLRQGRNTYYAARNSRVKGQKGKFITLWMHRVIMGAKKGEIIDHLDRNGLNNIRKNLRFCTPSQNMLNRGKQKNNSSGYKGIYWENNLNKWVARITINKHRKRLGVFDNKVEAARAYDNYAIKNIGSMAVTNFEIDNSSKVS